VRYANLTPGAHKLSVIDRGGAVNIDDFVLESSYSNARPATHPGATSTGAATALPGQNLVQTLSVPAGATALSIVVETSVAAPLQLALLDPLGHTVGTASDDGSGTSTLDAFVSQSGSYVLQVVNLSLGPVSVSTTVTPTLAQ